MADTVWLPIPKVVDDVNTLPLGVVLVMMGVPST
jgi:hypothetical protein